MLAGREDVRALGERPARRHREAQGRSGRRVPDRARTSSARRSRLPRPDGRPVPNPDAVRRCRRAEESQVDATWRNYLANPKGTAVKFTRGSADAPGTASSHARAASTSGASRATDDTRDRRGDQYRRAVRGGPELEQLTVERRRALGSDLSTLGIPTRTPSLSGRGSSADAGRGRRDLGEVRDLARAGAPRRAGCWRPSARTSSARSASPACTPGSRQILREWADQEEGQLSPDVQQFRTKMLASITDSLVPPAPRSRDRGRCVAIAYPGEQNIARRGAARRDAGDPPVASRVPPAGRPRRSSPARPATRSSSASRSSARGHGRARRRGRASTPGSRAPSGRIRPTGSRGASAKATGTRSTSSTTTPEPSCSSACWRRRGTAS